MKAMYQKSSRPHSLERHATVTRPPRKCRESGQGSLEALGVTVLAGLLVAALVGALVVSSPEMSTSIRTNICKIVSFGQGSCDDSTGNTETRAAEDFIPPQQCLVSSDENGLAGGLSATFIRVEGGGTWKVEELGDGTARLTRLRDGAVGATAGVPGSFSAVVTVDNNPIGLEASAGVSGMLGVNGGEIYYASSPEEAAAIMDGKKTDETKDFWAGDRGAIRWVVDQFGKNEHEDREPDEWFSDGYISGEASASATLTWANLEASATAEAHLGTRHHRDGGTTSYFTANAGAGASGTIAVADAGAEVSGTALIEVDRDANGDPVAMRITSETTTHDSAGHIGNPSTNPSLNSTTVQIPLTSEADRALASRVLWASGLPYMPGVTDGVTSFDNAAGVWDLPTISRDLSEAVNDRGHIWQQTHEVSTSNSGFDVSGAFIAELGIDATWSSEQMILTDYSYWDGDQWAKRPGCTN